MPFQIRERVKGKSFTRPEFIQFTPGTHVVRFLEPTENSRYDVTHFVVSPTTKATIKCLGEDCPVCLNNRKIYLEHPKNAYQIPGYFGKSDKYTLNVLDKTVIKVCSECGKEVFKVGTVFPPTCPSCNTMITTIEEKPSNKVKLLQLSKTSAQQITDIETATIDAESNIIPITSYDVIFKVSVSNGKKTVTPIAAPLSNAPVEVPADALLDKDAVMTLEADEIIDFLKGVSLKDIFTARRASTTAEAEPTAESEEVEQRLGDHTTKLISELYPE